MNIALIVAAGSGTRFTADKPKQFTHLLGKPLIVHTLEKFEHCSAVDRIVLVLSDAGRKEFEALAASSTFSKLDTIVAGGETRAESVRNGLLALTADADNIVAVHDGARPLVTADEIARTIAKAAETGAACVVAELNDTIKQLEGGSVVRTIDRTTLRRALTPQAFRHDIVLKAFEGAELDDNVTDECYLVEKLGVAIAAVEGSSRNIKITRQEDIFLAEKFLRFEEKAANG